MSIHSCKVYIICLILLTTLFANKTKFKLNLDSTANTPEKFQELLKWGTYKPQLIAGVSERNTETNSSINLSMLYYDTTKLESYHDIRFRITDRKSEDDIFKHEVSDGLNYSKHYLKEKDSGFEIENLFTKLKAEKDNHQFIYQIKKLSSGKPLGIILAIAVESLDQNNVDPRKLEVSMVKDGNYQIKSFIDNRVIETFDIVLNSKEKSKSSSKNNKIKFNVFQKDTTTNWDIREAIFNDIDSEIPKKKGFFSNLFSKIFGSGNKEVGNLAKKQNNKLRGNKRGTVAYINFNIDKDIDYEINIQYMDNGASYVADKDEINELLKYQSIQTHERLEDKFKISHFDYATCAKLSFSELIGGLQYSYGTIKCIQKDSNCDKPLSMLSHTPSRAGFPRPFLWDEGFHSLITFNYYPQLPKLILSDWFSTMSDSGWIPREHARGQELQSYIPWLMEDDRDANPPTFMFVIRRFLNENTMNSLNTVKEFFDDNWDRIKLWFDWWYKIQGVYDNKTKKHTNFFKWWGPSPNVNLGSGMDDFPRSSGDYISYANIDATCWAYFFSQVMVEIINSSYVNEHEPYVSYIKDINDSIKANIKSFYDKDGIAKDILVHKDDSTKKIPSPHIGYPSMHPLFFGLIEKDSINLKNLLTFMSDPETVFTDYGISSLSKKDEFYGKDSNYWRGPIWINSNYLILRGLKNYYFDNNDAKILYISLRTNLMNTICGQYEKRGYFYEHYNQNHDGQGSGNRPFNGWTSLITLIIGEIFE